ncbi:MAG: hypothetical protein KDA21_12765 [Phycisphaerales bacterium]|nr:hypothetical protein [Phycisphaerales bacterium]
MHFDLVDAVVERGTDAIVTMKSVTNAEEYLQDHFPGFPVLPGVFMIEAMVQAARRLLECGDADGNGGSDCRYVLGSVRALKYGTFVRPGETMRIAIEVRQRHDDGRVECMGRGEVTGVAGDALGTCVSGRFTMRPVRPS